LKSRLGSPGHTNNLLQPMESYRRMAAVERPQAPGEGSPRRAVLEEIQVRLARTVRRPEPGNRDGRTRQRAEALRPPALPPNAVVTEPDLLGFRARPEAINVPVRMSGRLKVMCQACSETAGAVGAADVHVESGLKLEAAELTNADGRALVDVRRRS